MSVWQMVIMSALAKRNLRASNYYRTANTIGTIDTISTK